MKKATDKKLLQKKYSFDNETLKKIAKGAVYSGFYASAVFVLSQVNGMDFGNSSLNSLVVGFVPILLNTLKEWRAGK